MTMTVGNMWILSGIIAFILMIGAFIFFDKKLLFSDVLLSMGISVFGPAALIFTVVMICSEMVRRKIVIWEKKRKV